MKDESEKHSSDSSFLLPAFILHLVEPLGFEPRYRLCKSRVLPVRRRPLRDQQARCRIRTDDSTLARSRDGPFTNRARKCVQQKTPEPFRGFRGLLSFAKTFRRTLPALTILLVAALRGVNGRIGGGGVGGELGKCVEHGLHPPIRVRRRDLTGEKLALGHGPQAGRLN